MPDLVRVFNQRWKSIMALTVIATLIALLAASLSPKKYLSVATALPANSLTADKARMFNPNIEILYSDFGTPDELDKLEGTAMLDTIFIAAAHEFGLDNHYGMKSSGESFYKAALELKKNSRISRSGYGELKVKVWDKDRQMAATLANALMNKIGELHQNMQNATNAVVLQKMNEALGLKEQQFRTISDSLATTPLDAELRQLRKNTMLAELEQLQKSADQYQLALNTSVPVLITVEEARASLWPDKPKIGLTVLITFLAAFIFSFLMALFVESRKVRS